MTGQSRRKRLTLVVAVLLIGASMAAGPIREHWDRATWELVLAFFLVWTVDGARL